MSGLVQPCVTGFLLFGFIKEELDSTDTSVVISSCSLAEARLLLDNFLKASIDKVSWQLPWNRACITYPGGEAHRFGSLPPASFAGWDKLLNLQASGSVTIKAEH